jgi:hypothetical protein
MAKTSTTTPSNTMSNTMSVIELAKALPTPIFDNASALDALFFNTLDQHGNGFHVVLAKTAFRIGAREASGYASLSALEPAQPLATEDQHFEDNFRHSTLQESDLAPYKPKCDVLVLADAHAPGGRNVGQFAVQLLVQGPASAATAAASQHNSAPAREMLIIKHLHIFGPRQFSYQHGAWQLSAPHAITHLPLRHEYAAGGACMVLPDDDAASRVPASERLPEPDAETGAIAWQVAQTNPVGMGFCRNWYAKATHMQSVPAPQIDYPQAPFDVAAFERCLQGEAMPAPAGFGPIGRAWLPRRNLVGSVAEPSAPQPDDVPGLPPDFDYAWWNASPADQQCRHLSGGESIRLVNCCPLHHPASHVDSHGNHVIDIELPKAAMALLLATDNEQFRIENLVIDTVWVNVHEQRLELTWRMALPINPHADASTSISSMRLLHVQQPDQLERLAQLQHLASAKVM